MSKIRFERLLIIYAAYIVISAVHSLFFGDYFFQAVYEWAFLFGPLLFLVDLSSFWMPYVFFSLIILPMLAAPVVINSKYKIVSIVGFILGCFLWFGVGNIFYTIGV